MVYMEWKIKWVYRNFSVVSERLIRIAGDMCALEAVRFLGW